MKLPLHFGHDSVLENDIKISDIRYQLLPLYYFVEIINSNAKLVRMGKSISFLD